MVDSADLYTPTASFDVLSKCLKRMAIGNSKLVARLKENKHKKVREITLYYSSVLYFYLEKTIILVCVKKI